MKEYRYADGLEGVTLSEGMVRLDLFHYTGEPAGDGAGGKRCAREVTQQLILPPAGFLKAFDAMRRFVEQLEARGMVTRQPVQPQSPEARQGSGLHSASPNFE